jgi:tetratricopeptide (TPR) repeat protein
MANAGGYDLFGGVSLIKTHWCRLWISSLLLTALFGFAYGWKQREENPPPIITIGKEPPEYRLLKKGRYDEAAKAILDSIKDERRDYMKYQDLATVYYARAAKDPANREKWIEQASSFVDKSVSLAPTDPMNLMFAAFYIDRIGDASSQPCVYYTKAGKYAQEAINELQNDSIFVGDEKMPAQPIRDEIRKLLTGLEGKTSTKCANKS